MDHRPERIRIIHELGKPQSLLSGTDQFDVYGSGKNILFLGLGPDPSIAAAALSARPCPRNASVRYVECPAFASQMPAKWSAAIPQAWEHVSSEAVMHSLPDGYTVYFFRQNLRLFPSFWGPLLAAAQTHHLRTLQQNAHAAPFCPSSTVILPGRENGLLIRELASAFTAEGYTVRTIDPEDVAVSLPRMLADDRPALFFSVNGLGLDMFGERFHLLQHAGVPVVIWCVDTPWHILSGCKAPFWKEAHLCTTDASFLPALRAAGAKHAFHLPLATDPEIFRSVTCTGRPIEGHALQPALTDATVHAIPTPHPNHPDHPNHQDAFDLGSSVVFVGRSEFPERRKYFSGITPDPQLIHEAEMLLNKGERPDYHWWAARLKETRFWPDSPRNVGAGAEETSRRWRSLCLRHALPCNLTVFGDAGWKQHIIGLTDLRPPVDYYSGLAQIYRSAAVSLNITGLLLPGGLTQRHFDVWAAGGLLLTDRNSGLNIFPKHLVDAVCFRRAEEIPARINHLLANSHMTSQLRAAWREHIVAHHTYRNRVQSLFPLLSGTNQS